MVQPTFAHFFLRRLLGELWRRQNTPHAATQPSMHYFYCCGGLVSTPAFGVCSGKRNYLDDLRSLDKELYSNLVSLKVCRVGVVVGGAPHSFSVTVDFELMSRPWMRTMLRIWVSTLPSPTRHLEPHPLLISLLVVRRFQSTGFVSVASVPIASM